MPLPLTVILLITAVKLDDVWAQSGTDNRDVCQETICSEDCGTYGHCVELYDCSTACVCNDGFEGFPPYCTEIDCLLMQCGQNAMCVSDGRSNPICRCADGYLGNGQICSPAGDVCGPQCGNNEHNSVQNCACVCHDGFRRSTETCKGNGSLPATTPSVSNGQQSSTSVNPSSTEGVSASGGNGLLSSTTPTSSNGQPSLASVNPSYTEGVPGGTPTVEYRPSVSGTSSGDAAADFPVIAIIGASVGCGVFVLCLICALICCATRTRKQSTKKVQSPYRMPEENRDRLDEESVYNPSYQSVEHDVTTGDDMTKPNPTDPASFSKSVVIKSINPDDRDTHETAFPVTLPRIVHTTSYQKIDSSGANEATAKNGDNTTTPRVQKDPIRNTSHQSSASKSPDANGRTGNEPNSDTGPTEDRYSIVSKSDSQFDGSTDGSSIVDRQAAPYATIEHTQRPIVDEEYSQPKMARSENKMAGNDDRMARNGRMARSGDKLAGNVVNDDATYDTPDGELITDRGPLAQSPQRIGKDYPYAAIQKKSRRGKQAGDAEAGHVFSMGGDDLKSTGNTSGPDYEGGVYNVAYDSCDLKTTPEDDGDALTYYYVDEGKDKKHDGNKDRRTSSGLYESF